MSESKRTLENSSLELSEKTREEKADFHISNKIKLSNPLDLDDRIDTTGSRMNVYNYNRDSRGEKNGEYHNRNQMIDLPKLLQQLSFVRVVLKRLPFSKDATKLRITDDLAPADVGIVDQAIDVNVPQDKNVPPSKYIDDDGESNVDPVAIGGTCDIADGAEQKFADGSTATCNRKKSADLIKRSCPKCKTLVADAKIKSKQLCTQCETPLNYQCARCDKQCNSYDSLFYHLSSICNAQNLDLKCPKCDYRTHARKLMATHKKYCSSRTIYSCSHCEFKTRDRSNLDLHMRIKHEVADGSTATCNRNKPADLIKRSCPKCKTVVDAKTKSKQLCTQCDTPLTYQCARCDEQYTYYRGCSAHLSVKCNAQNLDLKCSKCDYQTYSKILMYKHKTYCSRRTIYSCNHCEFKTRDRSNLNVHMRIKHEVADELTATCNRTKPADLIKRSCPKCKTVAVDAKTKSKQLCTQCDTPLTYQCARCDEQYNSYRVLLDHLSVKCNAQNLDLKCPMCNYRTHATFLMNVHLNRCLSGNNFSCDLCEYTTRLKINLLRHMTITHKDILKVDCSQCKTKANKCEQCKKKVLICESCRTGFSSTDSFQQHQKSCKPPVLECKYCPYQTNDNSKLRKHIKLEHLSGSIPRDLPVKD